MTDQIVYHIVEKYKSEFKYRRGVSTGFFTAPNDMTYSEAKKIVSNLRNLKNADFELMIHEGFKFFYGKHGNPTNRLGGEG